MSIHVYWDSDDHTIIRAEFTGRWDVAALHAANAEIVTLAAAVAHPVGIIADLSAATSQLPENPLAVFGQVNGSERSANLRDGGVVIVGANRLLRALYAAAARTVGRGAVTMTVRFAASVDEARAMLA